MVLPLALLDATGGEVGVPASMVISSVAGTLALLLGVIVALVRYNADTREKELVRRIEDSEERAAAAEKKASDAAAEASKRSYDQLERLHAAERAADRMQGEIQLVKQSSRAQVDDVEEIRRTMVTRDAFEAATKGIFDLLKRVEQDVRGRTSRSSPSSEMPAVRPPAPRPRPRDPRQDDDPDA